MEMPIAGTMCVSGSGIIIQVAKIKANTPMILSPVRDEASERRGLSCFSIFLRIGAAFSITIARVVRLMDLLPIQAGSHGELSPIIICIEKSNNGIAGSDVKPGGSGSGSEMGMAKISISRPKPRSFNEVLRSANDILSALCFSITPCSASEAAKFLFIWIIE